MAVCTKVSSLFEGDSHADSGLTDTGHNSVQCL